MEGAALRLFVLLSILLVCSDVIGANYFIDYVGGSDANNGTSTATPWKHLPYDVAATGSAAIIPVAGDTLALKGGVVYWATNNTANSYAIWTTGTGATNNPITVKTSETWGTGQAIFDCNLITNLSFCGINGNFFVFTNLEVRNAFQGYRDFGFYDIISSNYIHHLGEFPWSSAMGSANGGNAIYQQTTLGGIIMSNVITDCNYNAIAGLDPTNSIMWGNWISSIQNHGVQNWSHGYTVFAFNTVYNETNGFNHSDAIQVLGQDKNTTNIMAFNTFHDNIDCMNVQPYFTSISNTNVSGYFFVFGNQTWNGSPGASGTGGNANGSEFDTYGNAQGLFVFNNTFVDHNAGWGGFRMPTFRDTSLTISNVYVVNNLFYSSTGGFNDGYTNGSIKTIYTGYNCFSNSWRTEITLGSDTNAGNNLVTLATYKTDMAAQNLEKNSVAGTVNFTSYNFNGGTTTGNDFHLSSGAAIGNGTNLTTQWGQNTFAYLPPNFVIDPTKDITGVQRSASAQWDIGAYAYVSDPAITVQPSNQTVNLGQTATFTVTATGTAPITYYWYKQGSLIQAGASSSYTTSATTCAYNGNLAYVVVSNSVGMVTSSTASLTVNGCQGQPPTYTSQIGTANIGAARF